VLALQVQFTADKAVLIEERAFVLLNPDTDVHAGNRSAAPLPTPIAAVEPHASGD
jgi:hypothetical protein